MLEAIGRFLTIMSQLPSDVRLQISRMSTNEVWKIDELLDTIKSEIDAREASEGAKSSGVENRKPPINPNALVAKSPKEFKIRCAYCGSLHYSASCDKVLDCESRKKILANSNRCFNCLLKDHNTQCMSEKNCRHCKKCHHQSICDQVHTKVNLSMADESASSETSSTTTSATTTMINANVQQPKTVLLQTARAVALDETGKLSPPVRILFDTGSQRSYVTENLRSKLKLKSVQHKRLNLNTFGEARYKSQNCDLVHL